MLLIFVCVPVCVLFTQLHLVTVYTCALCIFCNSCAMRYLGFFLSRLLAVKCDKPSGAAMNYYCILVWGRCLCSVVFVCNASVVNFNCRFCE